MTCGLLSHSHCGGGFRVTDQPGPVLPFLVAQKQQMSPDRDMTVSQVPCCPVGRACSPLGPGERRGVRTVLTVPRPHEGWRRLLFLDVPAE